VTVRVLDRAAVDELLDPTELIDAVAVAMADLSTGRASAPPRIAATVGQAGLLAAMPAYCPTLDILAAKLLTIYGQNAVSGRPVHQAVIAAFDPATGDLRALMDGEAITALRTAAGSALSARLLARADAQVLAVIGTGPQARAHALLTAPVRAFQEVRVAGRDPAKATALRDDLAAHGLAVRACSIQDAIIDADVICAATSATEPIVHSRDVRDGAHIASVGYVPNGGEIELSLLGSSLLVVEHRTTALQPFPVGSNDIRAAIANGSVRAGDLAELGELVEGTHPGRTDDRQRTLYKSVGVAVQDAAAAAVVLRAAERNDIGINIPL
jgi:alanine dehydrogenase